MRNMQNPTSEYVMHLQVLVHTRDKSAVAYIALTTASCGYRVSKVLIGNNCVGIILNVFTYLENHKYKIGTERTLLRLQSDLDH